MKIIAIIRRGRTIAGIGKGRGPGLLIRGIMIAVDGQTLASNLLKEKRTKKKIRFQTTKK